MKLKLSPNRGIRLTLIAFLILNIGNLFITLNIHRYLLAIATILVMVVLILDIRAYTRKIHKEEKEITNA